MSLGWVIMRGYYGELWLLDRQLQGIKAIACESISISSCVTVCMCVIGLSLYIMLLK